MTGYRLVKEQAFYRIREPIPTHAVATNKNHIKQQNPTLSFDIHLINATYKMTGYRLVKEQVLYRIKEPTPTHLVVTKKS